MKPVKQPGKTILSMKIKDLAKVADSVTDQDLRDCRKEVIEVYGVKK
jgi:L-arabinose isomerase